MGNPGGSRSGSGHLEWLADLAQADDYSFFDQRVTDPPPDELLHRGQVYYLAHFNARRAVYSRQAPPAEPRL